MASSSLFLQLSASASRFHRPRVVYPTLCLLHLQQSNQAATHFLLRSPLAVSGRISGSSTCASSATPVSAITSDHELKLSSKVSAVLFDMDGVLCNSEERSRLAGVDLFAEMGVQVTEADCFPFMGTEGKATSKPKKRSKQKELERKKELEKEEEEEEEEEIYDWPRLICCFGEAMNDFVPTVRVSDKRQHPDKYSTWKMLQWKPPEFARILGGPSYNMAIALARQGCRVALMGKVGDDDYGQELVHTLNINRVQTRGVRFDPKVKTGISELGVSFEDGEVRMSCVQPSAENSLLEGEINADILKEATMFHFTSSILDVEPIRSSLFSALRMYKSSGGDVFFDVNLPLPLWISREHTWSVIKDAWMEANFIEVTKHELEFLLGEKNVRKRVPQYAVDGKEPRPLRDEYHYAPKEVVPLWHDNLKMLFVTDGTYVIHYYAFDFNGKVLGVEDVIVAAYTCDRAGSADAMVAGIIRKLNLHPEIYKDEVTLPKALRYAMSAGVIAQWTPGSTKGLPTESAAQNLTEQMYHPAFVQSIGTELYSTVSQDYLL